jgi:hypothetical protein
VLLLRVISLILIPFFLFALKIYSKKTIEENGKYILENPLIIYDNNSFIQAKKGIVEKNHIIKLNGNVIGFMAFRGPVPCRARCQRCWTVPCPIHRRGPCRGWELSASRGSL